MTITIPENIVFLIEFLIFVAWVSFILFLTTLGGNRPSNRKR